MKPRTYLDRYRVSADSNGQPVELRRTGNTITYLADDTIGCFKVAVKVIPSGTLHPTVLEKLEAEAKGLQALEHVNIPALRDFQIGQDQLVYVTEYFDDTPAEDWIKNNGPLPPGTVLHIALQAVSALSAATFHGVAHFAINPRNILFTPGQTPDGELPLIKILNFAGPTSGFSGTNCSTIDPTDAIQFASPEQRQGGAVDFASEVYSLGATLWYLLTGAPPLRAAASIANSHLPDLVTHLLEQMMASDPTERLLDPLALQEQIQDCLSKVDPSQPVESSVALVSEAAPSLQPGPLENTSPRRRFPPKALALAAFLLFFGIVAAVTLPNRFRSQQDSRSDRQPIGIPIGVPDDSPSSGVTANTSVTAPIQAESPVDAAPPVLTSVASARNDDESAPSDSAAAENAVVQADESFAAGERSQNEVISTPAATPEAPAVVAQHSSPNEASISEPAVPPPQTSEPESAPAGSSAEEANPTRREEAHVAKKANRMAKRARVPHDAARPRFAGTTPEGDLVFDLPAQTDGNVAAPTKPRRERVGRHAVRRALPVNELPVLPALPPDQ